MALAQSGFELFGENGGGNSGRIKSIQAGGGNLSSTFQNVNIDPVDPDKSVVLVTFRSTTSSLPATLTSASISPDGKSIYLRRHDDVGGGLVIYYWQVIEFEGVKSLQKGATLMTTQSLNVTIDPIDISKSLLFFSNYFHSTSYTTPDALLMGQIVNQTTLGFQQYTTRSRTVEWQVIEFE